MDDQEHPENSPRDMSEEFIAKMLKSTMRAVREVEDERRKIHEAERMLVPQWRQSRWRRGQLAAQEVLQILWPLAVIALAIRAWLG